MAGKQGWLALHWCLLQGKSCLREAPKKPFPPCPYLPLVWAHDEGHLEKFLDALRCVSRGVWNRQRRLAECGFPWSSSLPWW